MILTQVKLRLLALAMVHLPVIAAQTATPFPVFDCSNPNFQVIYTACTAGDYTRCCAAGSSCCAGGCCPITANCINVGTAQEACCPATDPTVCGFEDAGTPGSGTTPPLSGQSVTCEGGNGLSAYFCPYGSTCNPTDDSCVLPDGSSSSGTSAGTGSASSGSGSETSSSFVPEETGRTTRTTVDSESSTTEPSDTESTTTEDSTQGTTSSSSGDTTTSSPSTDTSAPATVVVTTTATTPTSTNGAPWVDTGLAYFYGSTVWGIVQLLI